MEKIKNNENWETKENKVLDGVKKVAWVLVATIIATSSANADELKIWEKISFPVKKEFKVSKISEVKKICANVAEDIDGWKYVVKLPTSMYERYRDDIINKFPENEWCTFIIATRKTKTFIETNVVYTSAFWDTDASDIVEKEEEQVRTKEEQVRKLEKLVKAKWYLGYLQDKVILMWNNIDNISLINNTLDEILKNLRIWDLRWNKYWEAIKDLLFTIKVFYANNYVISNKIEKILKKINLD